MRKCYRTWTLPKSAKRLFNGVQISVSNPFFKEGMRNFQVNFLVTHFGTNDGSNPRVKVLVVELRPKLVKRRLPEVMHGV